MHCKDCCCHNCIRFTGPECECPDNHFGCETPKLGASKHCKSCDVCDYFVEREAAETSPADGRA